MSAEQDRVHEASPIRLLRAREDGMVARSAELSRSLVFCVLLGVGFLSLGYFQSLFAEQLVHSIAQAEVSWSSEMLNGKQVGKLVFPLLTLLISIALMALAAWHFQSPLSIRMEKATPDMSRISPLNAWSRLFSANHWIKILIWIIGLAVAAFLAFAFTWNQSNELASIASLELEHGLSQASSFLRNSLIAAGAIILVLGVADYVRERIRLIIQLRMTDRERRDEARDSGMNPELRRRMLE